MKRCVPSITVHAGIDIMGFDFYATVEVEIWSDPVPSSWTDPGDPAEYLPTRIILQTDEPHKLGPKWEVDPDSKQFLWLAEAFDAQIEREVYEDFAERDYLRRHAVWSRGDE
jgi:hypothetical protein